MNHPSGEICVCENWNSGPAMMSFVGLESNSEKHQFSWDWETNSPLIMATTNTNAYGGGGGGGFPGGEFATSVTVPSALHYSEIPAGLAGNRSGYGGFVKREEGFGDQSRNYQSGRIGLNLGHRTYFSSQDNPMINRLFRRSRGYLQPATQIPRCQAEGCKIDLSTAKHYHRRHKVCEFHSKAIRVITGGLEQRFCQQCSRFHVLAEFDEAKRSCRKRLADHNRRRRKPQPGAEASSAKSAENGPEKTRPTGVTSHVVSVSSSELKATSPSPSLPLMINSSSKVQQHREPLQQYLQKGPALSLGGIEFESTNTQQQPFSSSTHNFLPSTREIPMDLSPWMIASSCRVSNNHHNLFYASSHQASQSTGGGTSDQSVFEVQQL